MHLGFFLFLNTDSANVNIKFYLINIPVANVSEILSY
jgi:hypothetical protein